MRYRNETHREYALIFSEGGGENTEEKSYADNGDIGTKYGWYCLIHRMAGGDLLKMDEVVMQPVNSALNWLSYTKDVELMEELNRK